MSLAILHALAVSSALAGPADGLAVSGEAPSGAPNARSASTAQPSGVGPSTAFFYGPSPPVRELAQFERVVVEPGNVTRDELHALLDAGVRVYAYLSLGEVARTRAWYFELDRSIFLRSNPLWTSDVVDCSRKEWREFVVDRLVRDLAGRGFSGLFLDTLDSPIGAAGDERGRDRDGARARQIDGLVDLIAAIHARYPELGLFPNRGFEVLDRLAAAGVSFDGVAAESLLRGWDAARRNFVKVDPADRAWILTRLRDIKKRHSVPVVAIDYVPSANRPLARQTARAIAELGVVPWVATPDLATLGVGLVEVVPRRVLLLHDSEESEKVEYSMAHRVIALPLEHLGLIVELHDVRRGLPSHALAGRYAGVVTYFADDELSHHETYRRWLLEQIDAGVRVAVFGHFGFPPDPRFLERLGLKRVPDAEASDSRPLEILESDAELLGFETTLRKRSRGLVLLEADPRRLEVHLGLRCANGRDVAAVATGDWGGVALEPYVLEYGFRGRGRWILDPFAFVSKALALPPVPIPDLTTENGRRLLMVAIDGDGAVSRAALPGRPFAIEVILDEILKVYPLPATVSVIEGEISRDGRYPEHWRKLESIARAIFRLPHVEIASHSYSHPFDWSAAEAEPENPSHRLPIAGYRYSVEREILGSVAYINARLAPPGKRVKVFLWSGEAIATERALELTERAGLWNFNGGNTQVTFEHPSLTEVSPMGLAIGDGFQLYAAIMNENNFTGLWHGPFYGFQRVVETLQITDAPRRLKPLEIYYHFYSGTKLAALRSLQRNYDWVMRQETMPIWVSEYAAKAREFRDVTIARTLDGAWRLRGLRDLRTVRLPRALGWPDLPRSPDVTAVRDLTQGRYVSFLGGDVQEIRTRPEAPLEPHIEQCNARIACWRRTADGVRFSCRGHVPVELWLAGVDESSRVHWRGVELRGERSGDTWHFEFGGKEVTDALLVP